MLGIVHLIVASHLISSQRFYRWTAGTRDEPAPPRSEKHSFPVLNQVTANFSVDVNSFFGPTDNAPDYYVFTGFGYRF